MKILYSAFTAFPSAGSEAQCGWAWANAMRSYNEVYIVTRKQARQDIENYIRKNNIDNVTVFYHDIPDFLNVYCKTGKLYFPYYILWQATLKHTIKRLQREYDFDVIQHVTLGDFRIVGTAHKYAKHFVFGPVGGAQLTPPAFKPYIKGHEKSEKTREIINRLVKLNPFYRHALNKADLVLAANKETKDYLSSMLKDRSKCHLLTENGIMEQNLGDPDFTVKSQNDAVNLLWAGRMIYRKGLDFLFEALSMVETDRKFNLFLVGGGPEENHLKQKAQQLGITDKVTFYGKIPYTEMRRAYAISDLFVFPSLRETTGTVLFEAMSNGLPVLTFNQNGADLLIDDSCGRKVNVNQPLDAIKSDFAKQIKVLIENDELRVELGKGSFSKIKNSFTWESKCKSFSEEFLKDII